MSIPLIINGVTYDYPQAGDVDWGPEATDWAAAVTSGMLQKSGGLFQLLAEADFGTAYGIKSLYFKSRTASPADAGQIRFAHADVLNWRNQAGDGNLSLGVNASDLLTFNGTAIQNVVSVTDTATIDLTLVADVLSADVKSDSITNTQINSAAAIAYSKLALTGSIVNADINAAAAIAYSKLALSNSIVNADINASAAIAYSKLALTGSIVNADISASAAIAFSKLASLTSAHILVGSAGNVATDVAVTGDVTISNAGVTAIGANKVVNSMLAQMAQSTFKGRVAASGTGDPVDLTATQATAILNNFVGDSGSGGTKGLVLAPAAGDAAAGKFLKADGIWTSPPGGGDVVGPGSATDNAVTRFDGTTGKLLQNSGVIVDDSNNVTGVVNITPTGVLLSADGNASNPSISFAADVNTGIYRSAADTLEVVAGGYSGIEVKKSTGNFANVGLGGSASTSDSVLLALERSNSSAGTYASFSNTATDANAYGGIQVKGDNGNILGSLNAYTASSSVDCFISRVVLRCDSSATGINFVAVGAAPYNMKFYHNGGATTDISLQINSDKSLQFMQSISDPSAPASGIVLYGNSTNLRMRGTSGGAKQIIATELAAKGDIIAATGAAAASTVTVGANGKVLGADSTASAGVSYQDPINFQNNLINGAFDWFQAGSSVTVANTVSTYLADQWYCKNSLGTNGVITYSLATGVTDGSKNGAKLLITTAPTAAQVNGCELYQPLSNQASFAMYNKTASFSVLVKSFGNVNQVGVSIGYVTSETKGFTLIGSEVLTTVNSSTFSACTINGQALGTGPTTSGIYVIKIRITGVSSGNTYDLNNGFVCEQAMFNLGPVAQPFQRQYSDPVSELNSCCYFFEAFNRNGLASAIVAFGFCSVANTTINAGITYRASKRIAPALTVSLASHFNCASAASNLAATAFTSLTNQTIEMATFSFTVGSTFTGNTPAEVITNNTAARIYSDARI